jgi:predicted nucleic acid-binding protein
MILKTQKVIVSDTSCLILLNKIGKISLLKALFGTITITSIIANEFGENLHDFIKIENPVDNRYQKILEGFLDKGEASAISLALEKEDCLLIIDELKGRKEARLIGLTITGTLGILIVAKEKGLIESISDVLERIKQTDFRISENLIRETLERCNE